MTLKSQMHVGTNTTTAALLGAAVVIVSMMAILKPAFGGAPQPHILAAELRIARADLMRLDGGNALAPLHVRGLKMRIVGALGILPWLLRQNGDDVGAERLRGWALKTLDNRTERARLIGLLETIIVRHPLDLSRYAVDRLTAVQKREARAIHETYCAGCHDGAGQGDADALLPARDLYSMARESSPEDFLARLINGVKGDETLLFANPLSAQQVAALWVLYRERTSSSGNPFLPNDGITRGVGLHRKGPYSLAKSIRAGAMW